VEKYITSINALMGTNYPNTSPSHTP